MGAYTLTGIYTAKRRAGDCNQVRYVNAIMVHSIHTRLVLNLIVHVAKINSHDGSRLYIRDDVRRLVFKFNRAARDYKPTPKNKEKKKKRHGGLEK
jgi:hypothetical protein